MPIKPENRHRYPDNWKVIRSQILERAEHRCEFCSVPNHVVVLRNGDTGDWIEEDGTVHDANTGEVLGLCRGSELPAGRFVRIVLTIAHLDHTPENNDPENLRALCQRCHLHYDQEHHAQNRYQTHRAQLAVGDLFEGTYQ